MSFAEFAHALVCSSLFLFLLFTGLVTFSQAQSSPVGDFYQKYKPKEAASQEEQIKWLDKLIPKEIRKAELESLLADPDKVKIIVLDREEVKSDDLDNLRNQTAEEQLDLLIRAKDQGESLDLFAKAEQGYIRQVLFLVTEEDDFVFLNLAGKWTFSDFIGNKKREAY